MVFFMVLRAGVESFSLSRLCRRRAGNRTFVNKTLEKIDQQLEDYTDDKSKKTKLKAFRDTLNEKLGVLTELNARILDQLDEDDFENEIDETRELKMTIQERSVNIELAIKADSSKSEDDDDIDSVRSSSRASSSKKTKGLTQTVKLPKLVIKKFGGNHTEHQAFWDSFDAAIYSNETLSDIEKLNYLRSFLEGPAVALIAGLALTKDNYKVAVDLQRERYGNKQVIISSHMESLLKLPRVNFALDIKHVCMVYDQIEIKIRSLQALGIKAESYGSLLIPVVMEKIVKNFGSLLVVK